MVKVASSRALTWIFTSIPFFPSGFVHIPNSAGGGIIKANIKHAKDDQNVYSCKQKISYSLSEVEGFQSSNHGKQFS
jgi:hypothetical protein